MRYEKKKVRPPNGLCVGAKVGVHGEGYEDFYITHISIDNDGDIVRVELSCLWAEPLSNIYLLNGKSHLEASRDPECNFQVAIGECDNCGLKFSDSCVYYEESGAMICVNCKKWGAASLPSSGTTLSVFVWREL